MENKYKPIPFWSWNDELDEKELVSLQKGLAVSLCTLEGDLLPHI